MNKNKLTAMFLASVMCCSNTTKVSAHGWLYHIGKAATYLGCVKIAKSIDLWDLSENVNNHTSLWLLANIAGYVATDCGYDKVCDKIKNYIAGGDRNSGKQKTK